MALLTNSFEGGTNGTALTTGNTGGASGNAFNNVTIGTSATYQFDSSVSAHGGMSVQCATSPVSASSFAYWGSSLGSGNAQVWFRMYMLFTQAPAQTHRIFNFWNTTSGSTICCTLQVTATQKVRWLNASSSTLTTSTASFPLNQWFRLEGFCIGSLTAGQTELKMFTTSPDATTPDETDTSVNTANTAGTIGTGGFGVSTNTISVNPFWMDDVALSTTGYLGPSATPVVFPNKLNQLNQAVNRSAVW